MTIYKFGEKPRDSIENEDTSKNVVCIDVADIPNNELRLLACKLSLRLNAHRLIIIGGNTEFNEYAIDCNKWGIEVEILAQSSRPPKGPHIVAIRETTDGKLDVVSI